MYSYKIRGDDYDTIIVDVYFSNWVLHVTQYYSDKGRVTKTDSTQLFIKMSEGTVEVNAVESNSFDTLVLPKSIIQTICPYAFKGTHFKRIVIPLDVHLHLCTKAFYECSDLTEFISLSRNVTYDTDVFPATVQRRIV